MLSEIVIPGHCYFIRGGLCYRRISTGYWYCRRLGAKSDTMVYGLYGAVIEFSSCDQRLVGGDSHVIIPDEEVDLYNQVAIVKQAT